MEMIVNNFFIFISRSYFFYVWGAWVYLFLVLRERLLSFLFLLPYTSCLQSSSCRSGDLARDLREEGDGKQWMINVK